MNFVVVVPARFFSKRFPGKLLANIHGKPMIVRVVEKALKSRAKKVIVATDSVEIAHVIELEKFPVEICLTRSDHQSGIERIKEVSVRYKFLDHQIIVHLQGDEPLITSDMINQVAHDLVISNSSMATLATPISSLEDAKNNNIVKVVMNVNNHALYFSRSMIPWCYDKYFENNKSYEDYKLLRHIGIYSYRNIFLNRYVKWTKSSLEKLEMLEQLRVLWKGETIYVSLIENIANVISVDTPEMLFRVNEYFHK